MTHNWRAIKAIARKDLRQVTQSRSTLLPMLLVPAVLLIVLPLILVLLPQFVDASELNVDDLQTILEIMPPNLRAQFEDLSPEQTWVMLNANYVFAPMFLIVPLMVSVILASDSFVGERERKTLEGLLYTPVSDTDLFVGKILAALVPALVIDVACFALYAVVVNAGGYRTMGHIFFPVAPWWAMVFWLGPAVSVAGLGATVLISSKVRTFVQAQQISGMLVLPIVFLMVGQISGLFFLGVPLIMILGLLIHGIGGLFVWLGAKTFSRGELIARV